MRRLSILAMAVGLWSCPSDPAQQLATPTSTETALAAPTPNTAPLLPPPPRPRHCMPGSAIGPDGRCPVAISPHFQSEIDQVDAGKTLVLVEDPAYYEFEWSYDGLTVTCGTPLACEYGASELLGAMGFRWYTPNPEFFHRPKSIPVNLKAPRTTYWLPNNSVFLVYGHTWSNSKLPSRRLLSARYEKWARLNGVAESAYPAGHRWRGVIEDPVSAPFFAENPALLRPTATGRTRTFDLVAIQGSSNWDRLAEFCAAYLLQAGLNPYNRTNFDPVDGDNNPSDLVYPFTLDVLKRMRAGTSAIGGIPPQKGVPTAEIGLYAYAGHRLPPAKPYKPVYTQVALAFNRTALTYDQLIERHGALAGSIGIREYLDTQAWSMGRPLVNGRTKEGYVDRYDRFVQSGARYTITENTGNWLVNLVIAQQFIRKLKTGKTVPQADIINELVNTVFDGDPAVRDLYLFWGDPANRYNRQSLARSFELVSAMKNGPRKEQFKKLMVILYEFEHLPEKQAYLGRNDPYPAAIASLLSKITAVRDEDITHSYAWVRRLANTALNDYPALKFNAKPEPLWLFAPQAPTDAEYEAAAAASAADR